MSNQIINFIDWSLGLISIVTTLVVIYGGTKFILSRGNREKEKSSEKMFVYGCVILIVLGLVYAISIPTVAPPLSN